jgi:hypothetical protein
VSESSARTETVPSPVSWDVGVIEIVGGVLGSVGGGVAGTGVVGCVEGSVVRPGAVDGVSCGLWGGRLVSGLGVAVRGVADGVVKRGGVTVPGRRGPGLVVVIGSATAGEMPTMSEITTTAPTARRRRFRGVRRRSIDVPPVRPYEPVV